MKDNDYNDKYDTIEINLPDKYRTKRKWKKKQIINICVISIVSFVFIAFSIIVVSNNHNVSRNNIEESSTLSSEMSSKPESKVSTYKKKKINSNNINNTSSKMDNVSNKYNSYIESSIEEKIKNESVDENLIKKDENFESDNVIEISKEPSNEEVPEVLNQESSIEVTEPLQEKYADVQSVYYILDDGTEACYFDFMEPTTIGVRIVFNETQNIDTSDILNSFNVSGNIEFSNISFKDNIFTARVYVGNKSSVSFLEYYSPGNLITSN